MHRFLTKTQDTVEDKQKDNDNKGNKDKDECNDKDKGKGKDKCKDKDHKSIRAKTRLEKTEEWPTRQSEDDRGEKTETKILHLWSLGRYRLLLSG